MGVIEGFLNLLGQLKDTPIGKIMIGLSIFGFGGILLIANPNGSGFDQLFELIDTFDLIWWIIVAVGIIVLVVGIYELLKEVGWIR
ncbi:MAG: hypothetical protein ACXADY_02875 [Candidatus Hodarchaeales archaeon]|jgi:hypothetical protein